MLRQTACEYKVLPVHLVPDNAGYQKCAAVQEPAEKPGIALEYIPPYSPNLNLIKRIWKQKTKIDKLIGKGIQLYHDIREVDGNTFSCPEKANNAA